MTKTRVSDTTNLHLCVLAYCSQETVSRAAAQDEAGRDFNASLTETVSEEATQEAEVNGL